MDMRDRIERGLGGFERAVGKLPGYRGYKQKEMAREADAMVRDQINRGIAVELDRLAVLQQKLMSGGGLRYLDDVDAIMRRLQTLGTTVRTASYGYAGLFDAVKVKEVELDALYEHDAALLESLPSLTAAVAGLEAATGDPQGLEKAIGELEKAASELRRQWDQRREALLRAGVAADVDAPGEQQ